MENYQIKISKAHLTISTWILIFRVLTHTMLHTDVLNLMKTFRYDAHPMGILISTISAYSTLKPEANPALSG